VKLHEIKLKDIVNNEYKNGKKFIKRNLVKKAEDINIWFKKALNAAKKKENFHKIIYGKSKDPLDSLMVFCPREKQNGNDTVPSAKVSIYYDDKIGSTHLAQIPLK